MRSGIVVFGMLGLLGCGGRCEDPGNQKPVVGDPAPTGDGSSGSGSSTNSGSPSSLPMHPLGQCVHGFERKSNPARACEWISPSGECFDSIAAACACICPTSGQSVCSAAFSPGPGGSTTVYCDKA